MRNIDTIVLHMSYTPPSRDIGAADIRRWHVNDQGWRDIGYHWVIRRGGAIEQGRPETERGAHVAGHNAHSLGICLVGGRAEDAQVVECNYTLHQWDALRELLSELSIRYPLARIVGHNDLVARGCPGFNAKTLYWRPEHEDANG